MVSYTLEYKNSDLFYSGFHGTFSFSFHLIMLNKRLRIAGISVCLEVVTVTYTCSLTALYRCGLMIFTHNDRPIPRIPYVDIQFERNACRQLNVLFSVVVFSCCCCSSSSISRNS